MATEEVYKYQIYCFTEAKNVYIWDTEEPTSCPNDIPEETAHNINTETITIIETIRTGDVNITGVDIDGDTNLPTQTHGFQDLTGHDVFRKGYHFIAEPYIISQQQAAYDATMMLQGLVFGLDENVRGGDYIEVEMVDVDNILGYGAGLVLVKFAETIYVYPNQIFECVCDDAKTLPPGIYVRFSYYSYDPNDDLSSSSSSLPIIDHVHVTIQHAFIGYGFTRR